LVSLIKRLDTVLKNNDKKTIYATVVLLSSDVEGTSAKLKSLAADAKIEKVPLTVAAAGEKGPKPYKISKDVTFTCVVYDDGKKVTNTFAYDAIDEASASAAVSAFAKVAGVEESKDGGAKKSFR
jgi:hypothetical protein